MTLLLQNLTRKYHGWIHLGCGLLTGLFFLNFGWISVLIGVVGSFLPDVDHIIYIFTYGKKSEYSKNAIKALNKGGIMEYIEYALKNHKNHTSLLSHNLLSTLLSLCLGLLVTVSGLQFWGILGFAMFFHFVYDVIEDYLLLGALNPNWFLRFGKHLRSRG